VVFRSENVTGPYAPGPANPILTQRDLDPARAFPVAAAGHADFVESENGDWWTVFLATRPYERNLSNLGRETFLLPVSWDRGWPSILPPNTPVPLVHARPSLPQTLVIDRSHWRDSFELKNLAPDWEMIRTPTESWYRSGATAGSSATAGLSLLARPVSISGSGNPSFLGKRQRHENAVVETEIRDTSLAAGECAGLVAFADERHHYFLGLCQMLQGSMLVVTERNGADDPEEGRIVASAAYSGAAGEPIRLQVRARVARYDFSYAVEGAVWRPLLANADGKILASEPTNQFTGTLIGVYAVRSVPR
jgi:xylan 1,4-beta-xylosidase